MRLARNCRNTRRGGTSRKVRKRRNTRRRPSARSRNNKTRNLRKKSRRKGKRGGVTDTRAAATAAIKAGLLLPAGNVMEMTPAMERAQAEYDRKAAARTVAEAGRENNRERNSAAAAARVAAYNAEIAAKDRAVDGRVDDAQRVAQRLGGRSQVYPYDSVDGVNIDTTEDSVGTRQRTKGPVGSGLDPKGWG